MTLFLGTAGSLLGLSFLLGRAVQISEGGGPTPIPAYGRGYWLWLGSLGLALLSAVFSPLAAATGLERGRGFQR